VAVNCKSGELLHALRIERAAADHHVTPATDASADDQGANRADPTRRPLLRWRRRAPRTAMGGDGIEPPTPCV
jgi:hypothetical protein